MVPIVRHIENQLNFFQDIFNASISNTNASNRFNDTFLSKQWHYYTDGTINNSIEGCDINVFPAWKNYTKGNSNIIVAVVDEGVDFAHEDLYSNMWQNSSQTGSNRYGYNFVSNNYRVTGGNHGTHVAGTIAAVNNNGLGVGGMAGGDNINVIAGVGIMSGQIF